MFYIIANPAAYTIDFAKRFIYEKQNSEFINKEVDHILQLQPLTELKVEAQISGNCSWANVEATIPALFFLVLMQLNKDSGAMSHYKTLAINFFNRFREWNKDRALSYCISSFHKADAIRKASKAEILAAILFQRCDPRNPNDEVRINDILGVFLHSPYEYILKNYLRIYYYESPSEEGKHFLALLKEAGFKLG